MTIKTCWPEDTENDIYISANYSDVPLSEIIENVKEKWPNATFDDISIAAEYIHTSRITYDLYDASDYTNFLHISYEGKEK